ncbi:hypothetical protein [Catellatospora chokoriensis]|nr:hypothetical protein [Catellatospora chokoriensis]
MNTNQEIQDAFRDFHSGKFGVELCGWSQDGWREP